MGAWIDPVRASTLGAALIFGVVAVAVVARAPLGADGLAIASSDARVVPKSDVVDVARSSPKATATASAEASAEPVSGDAAELRVRFSRAVDRRDLQNAVAVLERLLQVDDEAIRERDVRQAVIDLSQRVTQVNGTLPDQFFELIATGMGETGGDILYELVSTKGGSRAAKRAQDLLDKPDVLDRCSDAMRIAYDLRRARSCDAKAKLLDRAESEGDGRTLGQLQVLNCTYSRRGCCLKADPRLAKAIEAIESRSK